MSSAFAIFISLQILGWFGYVTPPETAEIFQQSTTTLTTIRILIGPFVAVLLIAAISIAWFFPLNRDRQARIRRMLERRQRRLDRKQKKEH